MAKPHVLILGAGPAGLGAAFQLSRKGNARISVLEKHKTVGGHAASFQISGIQVDYGSHRLHPACDPKIFHDIKELLRGDLLDRPRHGRIRLENRWIHFPLKPLDLLWKMPPRFAAGTAKDLIGKTFTRNTNPGRERTFASILEQGLGRTICREFYFPYARKIWGLPPEELSPIQAQRRVSANSVGKMVSKVLSAFPVFKGAGNGRFFYPKDGFGQIAESLYHEAKSAGAKFYLNAKLISLRRNGKRIRSVCSNQDGKPTEHFAEYVWSTIPITTLVQSFRPEPPASVLLATHNIQFRAMILVYLVLEQGRFSEYDAHY
ncbi:MAG: FAD-dependent oxidoreductase, partial [Candidatus Hodarchaeales archaeon]